MTTAEIKELQVRVNTTPDGLWGPKSTAAAKAHLNALKPPKNPWPSSDQKSLTAFYGAPGDESQLVNMPVPAGVEVHYDGKPVKTIRCHRKIGPSLTRILIELSKFPEGRAVLKKYAGVYNNRPMRGGSTPSLHARGAAIDLDPGSNGNNSHWPTKSTMPIEVMEAFAREGWLSAGAEWPSNRDAMHFQSTT